MKTHPEPAALVALALLLTGCPQGSADDTGCDGLGWVEGTIVDLDGEPLLDADLTARSDLQDDIAVPSSLGTGCSAGSTPRQAPAAKTARCTPVRM
jgi:hypothetical protein